MTIPSQLIDGTIFKSSPISWNFQCVYDTTIDISSDEMTMDASSRTGDFSGVGQFDVQIRTITQNYFEHHLVLVDFNFVFCKPIKFLQVN